MMRVRACGGKGREDSSASARYGTIGPSVSAPWSGPSPGTVCLGWPYQGHKASLRQRNSWDHWDKRTPPPQWLEEGETTWKPKSQFRHQESLRL